MIACGSIWIPNLVMPSDLTVSSTQTTRRCKTVVAGDHGTGLRVLREAARIARAGRRW
jgi:hypothetical protein